MNSAPLAAQKVAVSARPGSFVGVSSAASTAGVASNGGVGGAGSIGGGCDTTPPRLRSRSSAAAAGGGVASGSGSGSGGRRSTGSAFRDRAGGDRPSDLPPPKRLLKEEDEEDHEEDHNGDTSASSEDEGFEGASAVAVGVVGQGGDLGSEATEGGMPMSSPRSPLETSPRNSGERGLIVVLAALAFFGLV